ncbi:MAG: energy-coupling factor transporter transmembrane component T family protein [Salinarchaeum sp.]
MLRYTPADRFAHGLDPRAKLAFQVGFVAATVTVDQGIGLGVLAVVALIGLWSAGLSLGTALWTFRAPIALLAAGPIIAGLTFGSPWFESRAALKSARAGMAVLLALLIAGAYIRSTPVRETQAAIQWFLPGRPGRIFGVGVGLVFRLIPLIVEDLRRVRRAQLARRGDARGWTDQVADIGVAGLRRTFDRAERLGLALQARCFAWNPTLPPLCWRGRDTVVTTLGIGLTLAAVFAGPLQVT